MKKELNLLIVLMILSLSIHAQGNLQYNKVKLVTVSAGYNIQAKVDTIITVPSGKVWKIESAIVGSDQIAYTNNPSAYLYLDNQMIYQQNGATKIFPIWLPAGSYLLSIIPTYIYSAKGSISVIEYNEVP